MMKKLAGRCVCGTGRNEKSIEINEKVLLMKFVSDADGAVQGSTGGEKERKDNLLETGEHNLGDRLAFRRKTVCE